MKAKKFFILMGLILFMGITQIDAQDPFEGKVSYNTSIKGGTENVVMDYYMKGGQVRTETKYDNATQVMIMKEGKTFMIMPEQKIYMEFIKPDEEMTETKEPEVKVVKTDETQNILGYNCTKWIVNSKEGNTEMWLASGIGQYMFVGNPMAHQEASWQEGLENTDFFPLLIITKDKNGSEIFRQEATEIKKESLSDDLFAVPEGYQKMSMPGMPAKPKK